MYGSSDASDGAGEEGRFGVTRLLVALTRFAEVDADASSKPFEASVAFLFPRDLDELPAVPGVDMAFEMEV